MVSELTRFDNRPWQTETPLDAYPTIADFTVEAAPDVPAMFGVQMRWVSPTHGILSEFPWWDHLDKPGSRLVEDYWAGEWSEERPFVDADQDFWINMWVADDHVYVVSGLGPGDSNWYRVPRARFDSELARFRAGLAAGDIAAGSRPSNMRTMRRGLRVVLALMAIAALAVVAASVFQPRWFDHLEGRGIGTRLDALVTAAADGTTVDLAEAYPADWDRAIVIGGYWSGSLANSALGFAYFHPDEMLSYSEGPHRIVFARGSDVLADVDLQTFSFADDVAVITPETSALVVNRSDGRATLERAP